MIKRDWMKMTEKKRKSLKKVKTNVTSPSVSSSSNFTQVPVNPESLSSSLSRIAINSFSFLFRVFFL